MNTVIGIELGTNSEAATLDGEQLKVIANEGRLSPRVMALDEKGKPSEVQIGKRQAVSDPENLIYPAKCFLGRRFGEVTEEPWRGPYTDLQSDDGPD